MNQSSIIKSANYPPNPVVQLDNIPDYLRSFRRFCAWKWQTRNDTSAKVPCNLYGHNLSVHETDRLVSFTETETAYIEGSIDGIGVVLGDGLCGIDLDDCFDDDGNLKPYATNILERIDSYAEKSPSGKGIKIIVAGSLPENCQRTRPRSGELKIEIYQRQRFFTLTGDVLNGFCDVGERSKELQEIYNEYIGTEPEPTESVNLPRVEGGKDFEAAVQACLQIPPKHKENDGSLRTLIWTGCCRSHGLSVDETVTAIGVAEDLMKYQLGEQANWLVKANERDIRRRYGQSKIEIGESKEVDWAALSVNHFRNTPAPESVVEVKPLGTPFWQFVKQHSQKPETIIDGLMHRGDIVNVIASAKLGKTFFADQMAVCLAAGREWFGHVTRPCRVLIIDCELQPYFVWSRLDYIRDSLNLPPEVMNNIQIESLRDNPQTLHQLCDRLKSMEPGTFDLIIFDTLYRMMPQGVSENNHEDLTGVYNKLLNAASQHGAAFVAIHHASKGSQARKKVTDIGSGAGVMSRAVDCHLVLLEHAEPDCVVMNAALRAFPPFKPVVLKRDFPLWVLNPDADPSQVVLGQKPEFTHEDFVEALNPGANYPIEKAAEFGRKQFGVTKKLSREWIKAAVSCGLLEEFRGERGTKMIRKPLTPEQTFERRLNLLRNATWPMNQTALAKAVGIEARSDAKAFIEQLLDTKFIRKCRGRQYELVPETNEEEK